MSILFQLMLFATLMFSSCHLNFFLTAQCLPSSFITKCLKEKVGDVTLCTLDGKTWPAKYCCYLTNNKYTKAALHCGWTAFMQDNKLELGDVCVFELIEQTKILLKVIIYRVSQDSSLVE